MRSLLRGFLCLSLAACAADKAPFDAPDLDEELTSEAIKADSTTNRTIVRGEIYADVAIADDFIAGKFVGYTFTGETGLKVTVSLSATDGISDPVLMLYGPQRPSGKWPRRLAMNDDFDGFDSKIEAFALPSDGTYMVVAGEYWRDAGSFKLVLELPGITCTREPTVDPADPRYDRFEGTSFNNDCASDYDCGTSGCSGEVCVAAGTAVFTTCEAVVKPAGSCGCHAGQCVWSEETCPRPLPGIGELCGPAGMCDDGLDCVAYYGILGPSGPLFESCEMRCDAGASCPAGLECVTIADGPGEVCRPTAPPSEIP